MLTMQLMLLFAVVVLKVVTAQEAFLEILPILKPIRKEVGSNLVLTCRPGGADTTQFTNLEWRYGGSNGVRIDITNKAKPLYVQKLLHEPGIMLIFNGLTKGQAGNYSCHANYAGDALSATVQVHTYVDVQFIDAPENQYPIAGQNFVVKCKVKGDPPPTIDWYRGDQLIESNSGKYVRNQDELHIANVTEEDDGIYKCSAVVVVTGVYKTRNIRVEVLVPPKIIPMKEISVIEGETASAKCSATGKPPPSYTWIKLPERNDLSITDRFSVRKTGELIMNRVEFRDDGYYQCKAENRAGQVEAKLKINVLVKPKIYELLNVTTQIENGTAIICKAIGRPPPNITFRKLSNPEPFYVGQQKSDPRIVLDQRKNEGTGESTGTLTISNISRTDDGLYQCIAENAPGAAYKNGHITVWFKPTFNRTKDLPPVWSWDSRPGNLSCLPEAIPNATITWRLNQIEISEENFQRGAIQRQVFQVFGRGPRSFLVVKPYNEQRYYTKYECIARNALGEASIKIDLKRAFVPKEVNQVRAESITATTIKFSIMAPNNYDGPPIKSYVVEYKSKMYPSWDQATRHSWSSGAPYILENLVPEKSYHFRFAAKNDVGLGQWRNTEEITMPPRSKPAEPIILLSSQISRNLTRGQEVASQYSNHFELRWNVPANNGEPIDYYDIKYCLIEKVNNAYHNKECKENVQQSIQYTNYQLENLLPNTLYVIELRAHNAIGFSTPAEIIVKTARGPITHLPSEPTAISSGLIVGIVVAVILVILLVIDLTCFLVNRNGLIAICCEKCGKKKSDEEDQKLGSYKAAPAHPNSLNLPQPIKLTGGPTSAVEEEQPLQRPIAEKQTSVEYDGHQVQTKSGGIIIGKHSAV